MTGRIVTGLNSSPVIGISVLGKGITRPIFHLHGKADAEIYWY